MGFIFTQSVHWFIFVFPCCILPFSSAFVCSRIFVRLCFTSSPKTGSNTTRVAYAFVLNTPIQTNRPLHCTDLSVQIDYNCNETI